MLEGRLIAYIVYVCTRLAENSILIAISKGLSIDSPCILPPVCKERWRICRGGIVLMATKVCQSVSPNR